MRVDRYLEYMTSSGFATCAWGLSLIGHGHDAWVNNVLRFSDNPDVDGYLRTRLNTNA